MKTPGPGTHRAQKLGCICKRGAFPRMTLKSPCAVHGEEAKRKRLTFRDDGEPTIRIRGEGRTTGIYTFNTNGRAILVDPPQRERTTGEAGRFIAGVDAADVRPTVHTVQEVGDWPEETFNDMDYGAEEDQ